MAFRVRVAAASISGAVFVNRRHLQQQQKTKETRGGPQLFFLHF